MVKPKISVVLPVYNAGIHLNKCIDSLICQTLKEIEIIIILDCPTDGSDKIVEEYSKKDARIHVIRNEHNLHIGMSRNRGLKLARGKYVAFCDHDDFLDPTMYERMYDKIEQEQTDIVCTPYVSVVDNEIRTILKYPSSVNSKELPRIMLQTIIGVNSKNDIMESYSFVGGVIWNKLFKLSIIQKYNICYVDTRFFLGEDKLFLIEYLHKCNSASYIDMALYFHKLEISNTGSTFTYQAPENMVNYLHYLSHFLKENALYEQLIFRFYNSVQLFVFKTIQTSSKVGLFYCFKTINRLKSDFLISEAFMKGKPVYMKRPTLKRKIGAAIISFLIRH